MKIKLLRKSGYAALFTALLLTTVTGCGASNQPNAANQSNAAQQSTSTSQTNAASQPKAVSQSRTNTTVIEKVKKPIVVQGAMPIEVEHLSKKLKNVKQEKSGTFVFYRGTIDHYPVIVVKTGKGMENAAAATAIAIERYKPRAIINEGTAGGHDPKLNVSDIVLGKRTANIGSFKTETKNLNQGMDPTQWIPMDLMASEGSGLGSESAKIRYYEGDAGLLAAARAVKGKYTKGKVVEGTIGSADIWNNEMDRIKWFHDKFGTSAEEMEGFSQAQIANAYNIPFLDIRVLSNNKTNGGQYNPNTAEPCQDYVYEVVKKYIATVAGK